MSSTLHIRDVCQFVKNYTELDMPCLSSLLLHFFYKTQNYICIAKTKSRQHEKSNTALHQTNG